MKQNVISKVLQIIRAFTDKNNWGVNELARYIEMPVSSVHRMLSVLKEENILTFSKDTKQYVIGDDFIRIASIISSNTDLKKIAQPYMQNAANNTGHAIYLAQYYPEHNKLAFIDSVKSAAALQYILSIGVLQPIHVAASGKSILAFLEEDIIKEILEQNIEDTRTREFVYKDLIKIRKNKYTITSNERKQGALSVGAPIFNSSNQVIGSVICVLPENMYNEKDKLLYINNITSAALKISRLLGYKE